MTRLTFWLLPLLAFVGLVLMSASSRSFHDLRLYSGDEYVFHSVVHQMWRGLLEGDLRSIFGIRFYAYGFPFFLTNMFSIVPGDVLRVEYLELVGPRVVSAIYAAGSVFILQLFFQRSLLAVCFGALVFTMPGFWAVGSYFAPDASILFYALLTMKLLDRDGLQLGTFWRGAILCWAVGLSHKFQLVFLAPVFAGYLVQCQRSGLSCLRGAAQCMFVVPIYGILNPFLIHPKGVALWWGAISEARVSNETGHGSGIYIGIFERISDGYGYYGGCLLLLLASLSAILILVEGWQNRKAEFDQLFSLYFLFLTFYLICAVNKAWPHYYLPSGLASAFLIFRTEFVKNLHTKPKALAALLVLGCNTLEIREKYDWLFNRRLEVLNTNSAELQIRSNPLTNYLKATDTTRLSYELGTDIDFYGAGIRPRNATLLTLPPLEYLAHRKARGRPYPQIVVLTRGSADLSGEGYSQTYRDNWSEVWHRD